MLVKIIMLRKVAIYLFLFLLITPTAFAEATSIPTISNNAYSEIITANGLGTTLALSPILINAEIKNLSEKKINLSKKEQEAIKNNLLARFHPSIIQERLLSRLHDHQNDNTLSLLSFYQSELATQMHGLRNDQLQPEHKTQLLEYQQKLMSQSAQGHRYKLITVFDKLNYQSQWQAALMQAMRESIYNELPEKKRHLYEVSTVQSIEQELSELNRVINMYSLKLVPSDQLIIYLDALHNNKTTLELINNLYHETLLEQKNNPLNAK